MDPPQTNMISQKVGFLYPIIQAPMAGVSTPQLAASVSNAGGLGMLGLGSSKAEKANEMILETKKLTKKPFGVNVFCNKPPVSNPRLEKEWLRCLDPLFKAVGAKSPAFPREIYKSFLQDSSMLTVLLESRPNVVSFHFGIPALEIIKKLKGLGIYTMCTVTNLQEALLVQDSGIDAVIAQGIEAGGHRGVFDEAARDEQWSTIVLVKILSQKLEIPIIAAGGIMDGGMARAMMDIGASGVQLGTAYILCSESAADNEYREDLKGPRSQSTQLTSAFSGRPARGITNHFINYCNTLIDPPIADYPLAYDVAKQLHAAEPEGQYEYAAHWAGQGAPMVRELGAEALTALIAEEMGLKPKAYCGFTS